MIAFVRDLAVASDGTHDLRAAIELAFDRLAGGGLFDIDPELDAGTRAVDTPKTGDVAFATLASSYESLVGLELEGRGERRRLIPRRSRRRAAGAFYTPAPLVEHILNGALDPIIEARLRDGTLGSIRVLDPACGSGNFLAAAARRLEPHLGPPAAASRVFGIDIDPTAVVLARASVSREHELTGNIRAGDALTDHPFDHPFEEPFDVVVGNPPFLNQLQSDTAVDRELARSLRDRTDGDVRGYSDMAAAFLRLALDWCRPGGRVGLVLPDSILATADARPVRASVARRATLRELWIADSPEFGAATVTTCAPILEIGGSRVASVARSTGAGFEPLAPLDLDHDELADAETWSQLTASMRGIPPIELADGATIADLADATADFRDQYYGLEGFILDLAEADDDLFPPIVTSGLIEPAACLWGRKPTRILKRRWDCPRIDLARMRRDGELAQWIDRRRIPKVIVATQTRVIEPFVDSAGSLVPSTPLITVTPKPDRSLWTIAAALASPVATALALGRYGGAALSADAIKLSAKQALRLPVAPASARRDEADALFEAAQWADEADRPALLRRFAHASIAAHGIEDDCSLERWYLSRLERRPRGRAAAR